MILKNTYIVTLCCLFNCMLFAQKYTEPDKMKQFNITVNHDDYTVKTQMLAANKNINVNNDRVYMWYGAQKIMETKGGFEGRLIHGKYVSFYLNNQLKEQGIIKYGLKSKKWKYWYPDGQLREIITWKNGVKNGSYVLYNDYGQLMAKSSFKDDKLNGKFYTYGPNGIITAKKKYKNGEEIMPKVKVEKIKKPKKEKKPKEIKVEEEKPKTETKPKKVKVKKKKSSGEKTDSTDTEKAKIITS